MTFEQIIDHSTPTLVDFYATWCGPCRAMMPVLDDLKVRLGDRVRIIKIDIDKNTDLAVAQKVMGVPTFALFKDGEEVWRNAGSMTAAAIEAVVAQHG